MTWGAVSNSNSNFKLQHNHSSFEAHGTFIGNLRLEGYKPTQLPIDSTFRFGASTRNYIIRERPQKGMRPIIDEIEKASEESEGGLLGLPESETELDVSIQDIL